MDFLNNLWQDVVGQSAATPSRDNSLDRPQTGLTDVNPPSNARGGGSADDFLLDESLYQLHHVKRMPFGTIRTITLAASCVTALVLAILSRRSLEFAQLKIPLAVSSIYSPVQSVGLSRIELCVNETEAFQMGLSDENTPRCHSYHLSEEVVDDSMWNMARTCLSISILLGGFLSVILVATVWYWQTINLKPCAIGLLLTYFLQSLSFFMYDSSLCRTHRCGIGRGTVLGVVGSFFWFIAALLCIRMDVDLTRRRRYLERKRRRAMKRLQKKRQKQRRKMKRETSTATETTRSSSEDGSLVDNVLTEYSKRVAQEITGNVSSNSSDEENPSSTDVSFDDSESLDEDENDGTCADEEDDRLYHI